MYIREWVPENESEDLGSSSSTSYLLWDLDKSLSLSKVLVSSSVKWIQTKYEKAINKVQVYIIIGSQS